MSITWIPGSRRRGGFETRPYMGRIALGAAVVAVIVYLIFPVIVVLAISFSAGNFLPSRRPVSRCAGISPSRAIRNG